MAKMAEMNFTSKEAIQKGYLEDKIVFLKPIPSRGSAMIKDASHVGYFMWEGAKKSFCLPTDGYGMLISPFKDEEEAAYFSKLLDIDLNIRKKEDNFWHDFEVTITKTPQFMHTGLKLNLADPMDNLRYRTLKLQREIAPSWDKRFERPNYTFSMVESDYEQKTENEEMSKMEAIYTHWGSIKHSTDKMREFLGTYLMEKKIVTKSDGEKFLTSEIQKLIKSDTDTVYKIITDENASIKYEIYNLIQIGAIKRKGVATYNIVGMEEKDLGYKDLVHEIKFLKENTDPLYLKMKAQLNSKE